MAKRRAGKARRSAGAARRSRGAGRGRVSRKKSARRAPRKAKAARKTVARRAPRRPARRPKVAKITRPTPAALQRERRKLADAEVVPTPPSTLDFNRKASPAASGRAATDQHRRAHTETGPDLTAGDIDADWGEAYADGDEAPGGDNPTPDQDVVEEIGRALGVEYEDAEELKGSDKITERDRRRWEYDPASAEDYRDRNRKE